MITCVVPVRSFSEKSVHRRERARIAIKIYEAASCVECEKSTVRNIQSVSALMDIIAPLSVIVDIVLMKKLSLFSQNPSTRIKMKFTILTLAAAFCLALVSSHPLPEDGLRSEVSTWAAHLSCLSLLTSPSILQRLIRGHFSHALSLNYLTRPARGTQLTECKVEFRRTTYFLQLTI